MCNAFVSQNDDKSVKGPPLLAVAFGQRNHGERLVGERANYSWLEPKQPDKTNANHAIDMYALQCVSLSRFFTLKSRIVRLNAILRVRSGKRFWLKSWTQWPGMFARR
ncbi:hypothetical protein AMAG_19650 [Allomyces macrogynus ATCC 38327]|uniref:Uncharacterized protein n=1 Tax=Allomyces macrogynus (strain ATCC 38327) TaxID=578462 RepID=A0A0L0SWY0_ALLM3|nr:hypothetical protein AMAG_19650 [Allomyces macrogynus ATCC 38327]|eukprot:KNE67058.1 hypothetical protein AMAG_19650 [Allomyces macrogynus ATCC 38327]